MARFTKQLRQQIVEEFARRHGGQFIPAPFVQEVKAKGKNHPAYDWFVWDESKAAFAYQVEQARDFASGLRVTFRVEEVGRNRRMTITESVMPMVISPMDGRRSGGGYYLVDPDNPEHMAEHCLQAASTLRSWFARYQSALSHAGISPSLIERAIRSLDAVGQSATEGAAA
jgi:hypothetical protein